MRSRRAPSTARRCEALVSGEPVRRDPCNASCAFAGEFKMGLRHGNGTMIRWRLSVRALNCWAGAVCGAPLTVGVGAAHSGWGAAHSGWGAGYCA